MEQKAQPNKKHILLLHEEITAAILNAQREVQKLYRAHPHYSEANLREAMAAELRAHGWKVESEHSFKRMHLGQSIGNSKVDLFVNDAVIVELKIADEFKASHRKQLQEYLLDGKQPIGMLLRFSVTTGKGFERHFEPRYAPPATSEKQK
jgi:GxxExxY protein